MKGGPTIGSYVEYTSMDDDTATIHKSSGRLSAVSPGNTVRFDVKPCFGSNIPFRTSSMRFPAYIASKLVANGFQQYPGNNNFF